MKIWHRVNLDREAEPLLQRLGIKYKPLLGLDPNDYRAVVFEIAESDPGWLQVASLIKPGEFDFVWTEFTESEILGAEWLQVGAAYMVGYPQPEDSLKWVENTFERGCPQCGVGAAQKAPFRIKGEPRLGKNDFASLYGGWPLFCRTELLAVFESEGIRGYEVWPVLLHKTGEPSQRIRQLMVGTIAAPALAEKLTEPEYFRKEICPTCGLVHYTPYMRGMMPLRRVSLATDVDFQRTHEWFGSGHAAQRRILVSNRVARLMVGRKWRGLVLWPVQLVEETR